MMMIMMMIMMTLLTMSSPSSSGCPGTGSSSGLGWGSVTRKQAKIWIEKYKPENIETLNLEFDSHQ